MFSSIFFCVSYFTKSLPQLVAVAWILGSVFYDINFVLNQSLFLIIYFYLVDAIERLLCFYLRVSFYFWFEFLFNLTNLYGTLGWQSSTFFVYQFNFFGNPFCEHVWFFPILAKIFYYFRYFVWFVVANARTFFDGNRNDSNNTLYI